MQTIGMGVPLNQEAIDMFILALISTMGSENKGHKIRKLEDVSKLIVVDNRTQISLYTYHRKYSQTEFKKAVLYSTVLHPTFQS